MKYFYLFVLFIFLGPWAGSQTLDLEAPLSSALQESSAFYTIQTGENLQRISQAAYGNSLLWPLIWTAGRQTLPDPEAITQGDRIQVPRLKEDLTAPQATAALEAAYQLTYLQYKALPSRTEAQRRWVLTQAAAAGLDPRSPS